MKRNIYLLTLLTLLFNTTLFAQEKPNIVFIMCDDLNDYQGVFGGHPNAKTPNIDKLAHSGIQFMNAQSNVPVCQPSRNSLFTGVYPHDSKDFGWTPHFKYKGLKNNKTFVQILKENGYTTLATGKLLHKNEKQIWSEWGLSEKHNYGPFAFDGENLVAHPKVPAPFSGIGPIDGSYGRLSDIGQMVEGWNKKVLRYNNEEDRDLLYDEKHADWAVSKLKELEKQSEPFFLGVGFVRPHTPLHAPDKYFDMFPLDEIELDKWIPNDKQDTYFEEIMGKDKKGPKYYRLLGESYEGNHELGLKKVLQAYLACVAFVDDQIGKVIDQVEKSSLSKNTIVILTSDHGWHMGEKEYLFKNSPWEESCRIPLVIKAPKNKKGAQINQPVSLIDLFPTVLDYAGIDASIKRDETLEASKIGGYSLKPFIENPETKEWKGPKGALSVVGVYGAYAKNFDVAVQSFSYRTENFRYIHYGNGKEELYDHRIDEYEWKNVAEDSKYNKEIKQLRKEMNQIIGQNIQ